MAIENRFTKQVSERYTISIEFEDRLPTGASISSGTITAINIATGATDTSILDSTTATVSGTQLRGFVKNGTDGVEYKITFLANLNDNPTSILEEDIIMRVENL